jgi:hypothetical protein
VHTHIYSIHRCIYFVLQEDGTTVSFYGIFEKYWPNNTTNRNDILLLRAGFMWPRHKDSVLSHSLTWKSTSAVNHVFCIAVGFGSKFMNGLQASTLLPPSKTTRDCCLWIISGNNYYLFAHSCMFMILLSRAVEKDILQIFCDRGSAHEQRSWHSVFFLPTKPFLLSKRRPIIFKLN